MSSVTDPRASYGEPAVLREDPSLGDALERVVEAGETLVVRRIDLLVEELAAHGWSLLTAAFSAVLAAAIAIAGWFIAVAGVIHWLDDHFARSAVELVVGAVHVVAGTAIFALGRRRSQARRQS